MGMAMDIGVLSCNDGDLSVSRKKMRKCIACVPIVDGECSSLAFARCHILSDQTGSGLNNRVMLTIAYYLVAMCVCMTVRREFEAREPH